MSAHNSESGAISTPHHIARQFFLKDPRILFSRYAFQVVKLVDLKSSRYTLPGYSVENLRDM